MAFTNHQPYVERRFDCDPLRLSRGATVVCVIGVRPARSSRNTRQLLASVQATDFDQGHAFGRLPTIAHSFPLGSVK